MSSTYCPCRFDETSELCRGCRGRCLRCNNPDCSGDCRATTVCMICGNESPFCVCLDIEGDYCSFCQCEDCDGSCREELSNCKHCKLQFCPGRCRPRRLYPCKKCKLLTNQTIQDGCPACKLNKRSWNFSVTEFTHLTGKMLVKYTKEREKYLRKRLKRPGFKTEESRKKYMSIWNIDIYDLA